MKFRRRATQDGHLEDAIKKWQQEMQQKQQRPSSLDSTYHPPDDKEEDSPRSARSASFTPDWDERHETGPPEYDERHDTEPPEYDERHEPEEIHEWEGQTSPPRRISITFMRHWGPRSWTVFYNGPYDNIRRMHVELGTQDECDRNVQGTLWHTMQKGTTVDLVDIH